MGRERWAWMIKTVIGQRFEIIFVDVLWEMVFVFGAQRLRLLAARSLRSRLVASRFASSFD